MKRKRKQQGENSGWMTGILMAALGVVSLALVAGCPAPEEPLWDEPVEPEQPEEMRQETPMIEPESPVAPEPEEREAPEPLPWPEEN